jgi:four helix bundle protein
MRNFRELRVWKKAMKIAADIYRAASYLPDQEKFGLKSQMTRAAVSVPSNIAEGCSRSSNKLYKNFLEIALGSSFELETQFLLALEMKLIPADLSEDILSELNELQKMMNKLIFAVSEKDD